MSDTIRIYPYGTPERERLQRLADLLTIASLKGFTYHVEDVYFDFGQAWQWSTITTQSPEGLTWQILNPAIHADIVQGMDTLQAALTLKNGPYWED